MRHSYFTWDKHLFQSFQEGYIKNLNLDLYFDLSSHVAKRLYRFLDKRFYDGKPKLEINLRLLAHEHIGISRSYKYDSKVRSVMDKAHEELVEKGVISRYEYREGADGTIIVYYPARRVSRSNSSSQLNATADDDKRAEDMPLKSDRECISSNVDEFPSGAVHRLVVEFGFDRPTAEGFAKDPETGEAEILRQIEYLPHRKPGRNAAGLLRRAIEGKWAPPESYAKALETKEKKRQQTEKRLNEEAKNREKVLEEEERRLRFEAAWWEMEEEERVQLGERALESARERHPQAAKSAEKGRGKKVWESLVSAELMRLVLEETEGSV